MLSSPYKLPNICCKCGENHASQTRTIHNSQLGGLGYYFFFMTVKRNNYSFSVPVCLDCSDKLDRSDNFVKLTRIGFSVLFSLVFLYFFTVSGYFLVGGAVSIMVYIVLHLMFTNSPISPRGLGGYNGQFFWFSSWNFFRRFAELNPKLVSPYDYNRLILQTVNSDGRVASAKSGFVWSRSNIILTLVVLAMVMCISVFFCAPIVNIFIQ